MNEFLLMTGRQVPTGAMPYVGYNFDSNHSTGKMAVSNTTGNAGVGPVNTGAMGYKNAWNTPSVGSAVMRPVNLFEVGTGDFTLELVFSIISATSGYTTVFWAHNSANSASIAIQVGDNGFGNRLQFILYPQNQANYYAIPLVRSQMAGAWNRVTFQRRSGNVSIYLNGVLQGMARGTGTTYSTAPIADNTVLTSFTDCVVGNNDSGSRIAEFAFWQSAQYSADFTPKYPIAA